MISVLSDLHPTPALGKHYSSFDMLEKVLHDWSVHEKFSYHVSEQVSNRWIYEYIYKIANYH